MATINYENYYRVPANPPTECLTSFEAKIWHSFNDENQTPRLIASLHDCDLLTTIECINRIIGKLVSAAEQSIDDREERELRRKLKIVEARKHAHQQGTNELLIMSEV